MAGGVILGLGVSAEVLKEIRIIDGRKGHIVSKFFSKTQNRCSAWSSHNLSSKEEPIAFNVILRFVKRGQLCTKLSSY